MTASRAEALIRRGFSGPALSAELWSPFGIEVGSKYAQNLARAKRKLAPPIVRTPPRQQLRLWNEEPK